MCVCVWVCETPDEMPLLENNIFMQLIFFGWRWCKNLQILYHGIVAKFWKSHFYHFIIFIIILDKFYLCYVEHLWAQYVAQQFYGSGYEHVFVGNYVTVVLRSDCTSKLLYVLPYHFFLEIESTNKKNNSRSYQLASILVSQTSQM